MVSGVIFAVEEFAVHDGPGIRKTVFFKGCPLRCNWCHNPEGLSFAPELWVNSSLCQACGRCHAVCVTAGSYDRSSCTGCGNCLLVCPLRLRRICGRTVDAEALATELLIGNDLLAASGGGYTLSGGEPLAQPDFAAELIERLRPSHIALETSGFAPSAVFSRVCSLVDLVMIDIKQVDPVVHRAMTGVENRQILANLRDLIETGRPFIARIPLIPGVNDSLADMAATAGLLAGATGLLRVELLPYHRTAGAKYSLIGRQYEPLFDVDATPQIHQAPFSDAGLRSIVL